MYLPTLTNDELLRYAETLDLTPLESELIRRFEELQDDADDSKALAEMLEVQRDTAEVRVTELEEKVEALEKELRESLA